ncbi:testis-specific A2 protein [Thecamonas trahens ATCC 50062]|uniref:Testis-specific A2 protein n=1 Tax=Thecamonas trahens ATCC 50062 TaxID=461836 RepID=A0A0L0DBC7_THETB|nr:testis-specific A2 protein [Thecamonas trahens ATCC 50062]KNC48583.1 testis-specific A2 protein [Thecamonas trahens ATCC 50062]|eukprot:XP_013762639.1 testis-specific A2 protein [Thecamonas trahens ATCC 50062]
MDWQDGNESYDGTPDLGEYEGERHPTTRARHGKGRATLPHNDGSGLFDVYEGEYYEGERHGRGQYTYANGARYEGEYVKGRKHGEGTFFYPDGAVYVGEWENDAREGRGKYTYPNGDSYEGQWRQGLRWGAGVYTYGDSGSRYEGQWVRGARDGAGQWIHPGAKYNYTGSWVADKPTAVGKFTFDHGAVVHGRYTSVVAETYSEESASVVPEPTLQWTAETFDVVPPPATATGMTAEEIQAANAEAEAAVRAEALAAQ